MAKFDFDTPVNRKGSASFKWERYTGKDILPMWVADMDFRSPPAVIEALHQRTEHGVFGYTIPAQDLGEAVQTRLQVDFDWKIETEWLVWLPGLVTGLNVTCRSVGVDGDDVLTAIPVYPPFLTAPGYSRRHLQTVELSQTNGKWGFDFDGLEKAVTARTRLFILCNPHNPVGRVFDRNELRQLADICARHNLVICADEIHCDLILSRDKQHFPIAAIDPYIADRTITLMAPSKTYNLPGLGCSYAIIPNATLRRDFKRTMAGIVPNVNLMGLSAALAALRDDRRWLVSLLDYLRQNREIVSAAVKELAGMRMRHIEATYLAWIDTRDTGIAQPVAFFERAGVGLSDGVEFGGPGFVRLNFGCSKKTLTDGLQRMAEALAGR